MILANDYPYTGNGLGGLPDTIEATVTHEINGIYELFLRYPVTGTHYADLESGRVIMAAPDDLTDEQPFRIYRITKPLNGIVSVYARHICYDLQGIIVEPFTATSLTEAFLTIPTGCTPASPITLQTSRTVASGMTLSEPRPLWKLLGGQAGSILDVYGGEWDFDKQTATLVTKLGADRGVSIRYGKNMTEMEQDATIEGSYSGVYPYWYDEESNTLVTITEKIVPVAGSVVTDRVFVLDCSGDFENEPTEQDLRDRANAYISANSIGNVSASWKISFIDTSMNGFDRVMLGDTLHVYYERLDVNATARAVKTEFDVLQNRYKSITIGKVKQNLAQIIVNNQKEAESQYEGIKSALETAVDDATDFIRNGAGYMRFIYNSSNELQEIVSLDDPDILQASSVWRWNNGGFGHSSTGYNGTYDLAITQNGAIVADFITAGTLNANVIRAGILQDALANNYWNLDTGELHISSSNLNDDIENLYSSLSLTQEELSITIGRVENITVGGRNLLKDSGVDHSNTDSPTAIYYFGDSPPVDGEEVTLQIKGNAGEGADSFSVYNSGNTTLEYAFTSEEYDTETGIYKATFNWVVGGDNTYLSVYSLPADSTRTATIEWIKLERGNQATDWTPAPEDQTEATEAAQAAAEEAAESAEEALETTRKVEATMQFTVDGLKISGTEGSRDNSYVLIGADSQTFVVDNVEVMELGADGIVTQADITAAGTITGGAFDTGHWTITENASGIWSLNYHA